jgi:hypothetical protein
LCHNTEGTVEAKVALLNKLVALTKGKVKIVTMAAEREGAIELCKAAVQLGIKVSLGHQMAQEDDVEQLVVAGATMLTHLGNNPTAGEMEVVHTAWSMQGKAKADVTMSRHQNPLITGLVCCLLLLQNLCCFLQKNSSPLEAWCRTTPALA